MSAGFRAVQWNRGKLVYDAILIACGAAYVASFVLIARHLHPPQNRPTKSTSGSAPTAVVPFSC